jgi:hypothetical protein
MHKKPLPKLVLKRELILHLEAATLQDAVVGGLPSLMVACPTHIHTCVTCGGTCTC